MALFNNPELIKCMTVLPRDQSLLETDAPHGGVPPELNFGDCVTKLKTGGAIWPLTIWAATILETTPQKLEENHRQTFMRIYGKDFEKGVPGENADNNNGD